MEALWLLCMVLHLMLHGCAGELKILQSDHYFTSLGPLTIKNEHYGLQKVDGLRGNLTLFSASDYERFCFKNEQELHGLREALRERFENKIVLVSRYFADYDFEACFGSSPFYKDMEHCVDFVKYLRPQAIIYGLTRPFQPGFTYNVIYDDVGHTNVVPNTVLMELGTDATIQLFKEQGITNKSEFPVEITIDEERVCDFKRRYAWASVLIRLLGAGSFVVGGLSFHFWKNHRKPNAYTTVVLCTNGFTLVTLGIFLMVTAYRTTDSASYGVNTMINTLNFGSAAALDGLIGHRWESVNKMLKSGTSNEALAGVDCRLVFLSVFIVLDWASMIANYYISRYSSFLLLTLLPGIFFIVQLYCSSLLFRQMVDIIRALRNADDSVQGVNFDKLKTLLIKRMKFWIGVSVCSSFASMATFATIAATGFVYTCKGYLVLGLFGISTRILNGLSQSMVVRSPPTLKSNPYKVFSTNHHDNAKRVDLPSTNILSSSN